MLTICPNLFYSKKTHFCKAPEGTSQMPPQIPTQIQNDGAKVKLDTYSKKK